MSTKKRFYTKGTLRSIRILEVRKEELIIWVAGKGRGPGGGKDIHYNAQTAALFVDLYWNIFIFYDTISITDKLHTPMHTGTESRFLADFKAQYGNIEVFWVQQFIFYKKYVSFIFQISLNSSKISKIMQKKILWTVGVMATFVKNTFSTSKP